MKFRHVFFAFVSVFLLGIVVLYHSINEAEEKESERWYNYAVSRSRKAENLHTSKASEDVCSTGHSFPLPPEKIMGILLIRGASFIGYHVAKELILNGHFVTIMDSFDGDQKDDTAINHMKNLRIKKLENLGSEYLRVFKGDPCDLLPVRSLMKKHELSHIVYISQDTLQSTKTVNDTLYCMSKILEQMRLHNYIHFTLLSSLAVHFVENSIPSFFKSSKVLLSHNFRTIMYSSMENVLEFYHHFYGIPVTCMRLGRVYGPWMDLHDPLFHMLESSLHGGGKLYGDKQRRSSVLDSSTLDAVSKVNQSVINIQDVVFALMRILSKRHYCEYFDVGAKEPTSLAEIQELISKEAQSLLNPRHQTHQNTSALDFFGVKQPVQGVHHFQKCTNADHIRAILPDWSMPIKEGVRQLVRWYEKNRPRIFTKSERDIIFTTYFTTSPDPQRQSRVPNNSFDYMKIWYFSLVQSNLKAVIFHDGLSESFMNKFPKSHIDFHHSTLNQRSTNDARFYIYKKYLEDNPSIHRVILTDISDVKFQRNPFELFSVIGNYLFIGTDNDDFQNMNSMGWMKNKINGCFGDGIAHQGTGFEEVMKLKTVYNAGVIGGSRGIMLEFLHHVTDILDKTPPSLNCNMPTVNVVVHKYFCDRLFTGFPLTSRFYKRQKSPTGVYIIHK